MECCSRGMRLKDNNQKLCSGCKARKSTHRASRKRASEPPATGVQGRGRETSLGWPRKRLGFLRTTATTGWAARRALRFRCKCKFGVASSEENAAIPAATENQLIFGRLYDRNSFYRWWARAPRMQVQGCSFPPFLQQETFGNNLCVQENTRYIDKDGTFVQWFDNSEGR